MKLSTAAANAIADAYGTTFAYGVIDLFAGSMPADANSAITNTLLARITTSSGAVVQGTNTNGLRWSAASGGVIGIYSTNVWSGVAVATGTVGFAVLKANATIDDNGAVTTTAPRLLLTVSAGGGAEVNLSSLSLTSGATVSVASAAITQPRSE